jgi:WD40 repeat protein
MMSCRRLAPADISSSSMQPVFPPSGHYRPLLGFALTPDGKSAYSVGVSPVIHQWDVASTRRTRALTLPSGTARAVAVSRNGKFLAVAEEKSIHVFDCKTGRIVAHLDDHEGLITSLAFSPTEDLLVSRSMNGSSGFGTPPNAVSSHRSTWGWVNVPPGI